MMLTKYVQVLAYTHNKIETLPHRITSKYSSGLIPWPMHLCGIKNNLVISILAIGKFSICYGLCWYGISIRIDRNNVLQIFTWFYSWRRLQLCIILMESMNAIRDELLRWTFRFVTHRTFIPLLSILSQSNITYKYNILHVCKLYM